MSKPVSLAVLAALAVAPLASAQIAPEGWVLDWADEFDGPAIDAARWDVRTRADSFNNELQYYLPEQVSLLDGNLRITATDEPFAHRDYRSGLVESKTTLRYGRVEVRAKVPTGQGIWPAIWLLPIGTDWPTGGEIDIMEHGGSTPSVVSSAYHWGDTPGGPSSYVFHEHSTGELWPDAFHTYSVEWTPQSIRYFVDDVNHFTVTPDMAPISGTPMNLILNTAVGGWFDGDPDATTVFPQHFDIDSVRVYEKVSPADKDRLLNGDFEDGGDPWLLFGNAYVETHDPDATPARFAFEGEGGRALKMFGLFDGSDGRSYAFQDLIAVQPGDELVLSAMTRTNGDDSIAGTGNVAGMFLEFYSTYGEKLSTEWVAAADGAIAEDVWLERTLAGVAPAGAAYVRAGFDFDQSGVDGGAVWFDAVTLVPEPSAAGLLLMAGGVGLARRRRRGARPLC